MVCCSIGISQHVCACVLGMRTGHIKVSHSSAHRHNIELLLLAASTVTTSSARKLIALKNNAPLKGLQCHSVKLNATFLSFFLLSAMNSDGAALPKLRLLLKCLICCFSQSVYIYCKEIN